MNEIFQKNHYSPVRLSDGSGYDHFRRETLAWKNQPLLTKFINAVPEIIIVLDSNRQIVFANEAAGKLLNIKDSGELLGRSWGEISGCRYAFEPAGCGMARVCSVCGGQRAIETALKGMRDVQECRMRTKEGNALNLQITAVPVGFEQEMYVICTIRDISAQKRLQVIERIFFHDVTNTVIGVKSLAELLKDAKGEKVTELQEILAATAETLMDQIQSQRLLMMAENGTLPVTFQPMDSLAFLKGILAKWQAQGITRRLKLTVNADSVSVRFSSSEVILSQVLNSMMKNAFEASLRGMEIELNCYAEKQSVVFQVWNNTGIPEEIQLQLFQRYSSTRGEGRGMGTYSMKLLAEHYLGGKVGFSSGLNGRTMFYVSLPLVQRQAQTAITDGRKTQ